MPLSSLIEREFGIKTSSTDNPLISSIGAAAARLLPNNPNRLAWIAINLSVNTIYLAFTPDVAITKGIILAANGGSASMVYKEDFELVSREVYAIAPAGASAIYTVTVEIAGEE